MVTVSVAAAVFDDVELVPDDVLELLVDAMAEETEEDDEIALMSILPCFHQHAALVSLQKTSVILREEVKYSAYPGDFFQSISAFADAG